MRGVLWRACACVWLCALGCGAHAHAAEAGDGVGVAGVVVRCGGANTEPSSELTHLASAVSSHLLGRQQTHNDPSPREVAWVARYVGVQAQLEAARVATDWCVLSRHQPEEEVKVQNSTAEFLSPDDDEGLQNIPTALHLSDVGAFVWNFLVRLPLSVRLRVMGALDSANRREAEIVLGHGEHLLQAIHNFDLMRTAWRKEIRGPSPGSFLSLLTLYRRNVTTSNSTASNSTVQRPSDDGTPSQGDADEEPPKQTPGPSPLSPVSTPPLPLLQRVFASPAVDTRTAPLLPLSLVACLAHSTAHVSKSLCPFVGMIGSMDATMHGLDFWVDPSCGNRGAAPVATESANATTRTLDEVVVALERDVLNRTHAQFSLEDDEDTRGVDAMMKGLGMEVSDAVGKRKRARDGEGDFEDQAFSFLEVSSGEYRFGNGMFDNVESDYGVSKGDITGLYQRIMGMGAESDAKRYSIDKNGQISGFDLHFLEPVQKLLADRDFAADPKGFMRRVKAKQRRWRDTHRMVGDYHKDWNLDSEDSEDDEDDEGGGGDDSVTTALSTSQSSRDIGQSLSTETRVMASLCHHGLGNDIRESLAQKVRLHMGTECIDLIAGFISPIVKPIMKLGGGVFIELIGKAMTDAMADCLTFRLVGRFTPTIDAMLTRMMVPPMTMGIIMILPQALVKVLNNKFKVMLGAPLARAVVKAVLKYRSQVSTPMLYHTISHSLANSLEAILSNTLTHTITNTAGSALAHSLSHSLPAYYACMTCYHDRELGLLRASEGVQDACANCYNGNSLRAQERREYGQQRRVGFHTTTALHSPSHPPVSNGQGYLSTLFGLGKGSQTAAEKAAQVTSQDSS